MVKICLLFIKNMLNIKLHYINYCFNIALLLFTHTNLVYINIIIGIFLFLNVAPSQNLVFAPGASIRINTVCKQTPQIDGQQHSTHSFTLQSIHTERWQNQTLNSLLMFCIARCE